MNYRITLLCAALAFLGTLCLDRASASDRPNILFIVSDDHGWGDLPANWDKTEVKLPTLDALAAGGVRFPNYHTEPLCGPSRACMFTSQYSMENGMWRGPGKQKLGAPGYRGIKRDVKMLSEHLAEADYTTSFLRSDYVAILEHMDHNIGRLVDLLGDLGIAENTPIVFVSDNGACTMGDDTAGNYPGNNGLLGPTLHGTAFLH